jgi:membrane protein implicated in regulation of membrane protease activity
MEILTTPLLYWHWIITGLILIGIELLVLPGAFFLWIGISAIIVGGITFLIPLSLISQLLIFSPLALIITWAGKSYMKNSSPSDSPLLNRRGDQLIGTTLVLTNPIVDGHAQIIMGDSVWKVRGPDLPAGHHVIIKSIDGNTLIVVEKTR